MYKNNSSNLKCFLLKCPERKKQEFANSEAVLLISIGQPYHEAEKLWAVINFANKSFKKIHIMVNDGLQKHTIILNEYGKITPEEAYKRAIQDGKAWLERNTPLLHALTIPYEIHHWSSWLNKSDYIVYKNKVDDLYKNDPEFQKNMGASIREFLDRKPDKIKISGFEKARNLCLNYLLEECAVIMGVWQKHKYEFILYPGKIIDIMKYTRTKLLGVNNDMLYWLHVKFRRNNKKLYRKNHIDIYET